MKSHDYTDSKLPLIKKDIVIGNGIERGQLEKIISLKNKIHQINFISSKPNRELRTFMNSYDCLVLPSLYDGWGAVVNEGLMAGLFVICSDQCGAKELIKDKFNGIVFSHKKNQDLYKALTYCVTNKDEIRDKKETIKKWSKCIGPDVVAQYFFKTLNTDKIITPPWQKH